MHSQPYFVDWALEHLIVLYCRLLQNNYFATSTSNIADYSIAYVEFVNSDVRRKTRDFDLKNSYNCE